MDERYVLLSKDSFLTNKRFFNRAQQNDDAQ